MGSIYFIIFENIIQMLMTKMQHYRALTINLDNLYSSIKKFYQKELQIVSKYKETFNERLLRSIVAVNDSLKTWDGLYKEIHFS